MGGSPSKKTIPIREGPYVQNAKFHKTYTLSRELGKGAFSVVRACIHKRTQNESAVKILASKKMQPDEQAALKMEIEILYEMDHPHIVRMEEVYEESETYVVMEQVSGGELFDRIVSKTYYTEKEARDLIKIFLETMKFVHDKGIVHRDIKPENLLLQSNDDDANIKLADFGFAKRVKDLTPDEDACGTPNYVAPEILRGDPYGCEVDIWSMGVVCYILLAGYSPFFDDDQNKLFEKIKRGKYHFHEDYWSRISPEAIDLIKCMMTVDQKRRWTAEQLLQHTWITAADDELANKDISTTISELKRYTARRRLRAAANAVIMANRMGNLIGIKPAWMKESEAERKRLEEEAEAAKVASLTPEEQKLIDDAKNATKEEIALANSGSQATLPSTDENTSQPAPTPTPVPAPSGGSATVVVTEE